VGAKESSVCTPTVSPSWQAIQARRPRDHVKVAGGADASLHPSPQPTAHRILRTRYVSEFFSLCRDPLTTSTKFRDFVRKLRLESNESSGQRFTAFGFLIQWENTVIRRTEASWPSWQCGETHQMTTMAREQEVSCG